MTAAESLARACFDAALAAVRPACLLQSVDWHRLDGRRVVVVGAGKAAMAMAGVVEQHIEVAEGLVVVPHGYRVSFPLENPVPRSIEVVEAGHPVPDEAGADAAGRVLAMAEACGVDDTLLVLLSGGGSALWPAPGGGITIEHLRATNQLLLHSGASIAEINAVRKHLSQIKGGQLATAAFPAETVTLALSDVPGDDPAVIASGPTVPDPTTFGVAVAVLYRYGLWERVPLSVRLHLQRGQRGWIAETPKPGDPALARTRYALIGSNADARAAAAQAAEQAGYRVSVRENVSGEAREVGRMLAEAARAAEEKTCLVWGGETTVTVRGRGKGGRNQEVALAAALALEGCEKTIVVLSAGTDGIDGPTDAAGAVITPATTAQARPLGLTPEASLKNNDAYPLLQQVGALITTGPTHTNVMDVMIAVVGETG